MEVKACDIISSVDLTKSEALLPIYECIVNSIISLNKTERNEKQIEVIVKRRKSLGLSQSTLYDKKTDPIESVTIIDNGEGFTEENFASFKQPFGKFNKNFGCKGVGRFTVLALFRRMVITSVYQEQGRWCRRYFEFDATNEISAMQCEMLQEAELTTQTKVELIDCCNADIVPATAKGIEEIARGIMEHCFISLPSHRYVRGQRKP